MIYEFITKAEADAIAGIKLIWLDNGIFRVFTDQDIPDHIVNRDDSKAFAITSVSDFALVPEEYTKAIVMDGSNDNEFIWSSIGAVNGGTIYAGTTGFWHRLYYGDIEVKWFGAKGDYNPVTQIGTDDTDAIQSCLSFAYSKSTQTGWKSNAPKIHFSKGNYLVAQPNILFSGLTAGSFSIYGDGGMFSPSATTITYGVSSAVDGEYLINNNQVFGFTVFRDMSFTTINYGNFLSLVGGGPGSGNVQSITFESCSFSKWNDIVKTSLTTMTSEMSFIRCRITDFIGVGFKLGNPQGVNWRFLFTDIGGSGTVFEYTAGSTVLFIQGSVISTTTGVIVSIPETANGNYFGSGNSPDIHFVGTKFELRTGSVLFNKQSLSASFSAIFNGSSMGGFNITAGTMSIIWTGGGNLVFRDCKNMEKHFISYSSVGNVAAYADLKVIIDNCDLDNNFVTSSTFTLTTAEYNSKKYPIFSISNCGLAVDGVYRPKIITYDGIPARRLVSFSDEQCFANRLAPASIQLTLPPVTLHGIEFKPIFLSGHGAETATITVKNAALTTTLAVFTWTISGSGADFNKQIADVFYRVAAESGDYLVFELTSTVTTDLKFNGIMTLIY
jgi:hypothetical protein